MSEITLEGIAEVVRTEIEPVKTTLAEHTKTLNAQTTALANVAGDVKKVLDEKTVTAERIERLEHGLRRSARSLASKLEM